MDTNTQPRINPEAIILIESNYIRYPCELEDIESLVNLDYEHNMINENKGNGFLTINAEGKCANSQVKIYELRVRYLGIFTSEGNDENLPLSEFMKIHAPAHMFPYIREYVTSLTLKSGLPPIVLPPANMAALLNAKLTAKTSM